MSAIDAIREGNLQQALDLLQKEVRARPADAKLRVFLFQLLAVRGDWTRAMAQLDVIRTLDIAALPMVQSYQAVLQCEQLREAVFAGRFSPLVLGEPTPWLARLIEAVRLGATGDHEHAARLRQEAFEEAPATSGQLEGQAFDWIADADMRLGPVLELFLDGKYYWVPFERIQRLTLEAPADLRDLVWSPVHIVWTNGGEAFGFVPTRYPGTAQSNEDSLLLSRETRWQEPAPDNFWGLGQRLLATSAGDYALLECRQLELTPAHTN